MARKKVRVGRSRGQEAEVELTLDTSKAQRQLEATRRDIDRTAQAFSKLASRGADAILSPVTGPARDVAQTFQNLGGQFFGGNLQQLAGSISPTLGGIVGDVRQTLGGLSAREASSERLQGVAEKLTRLGLPVDSGLLREIAPGIEEEERAVEAARSSARDIAGDRASSDLGDFLYDNYSEFMRLFKLGGSRRKTR